MHLLLWGHSALIGKGRVVMVFCTGDLKIRDISGQSYTIWHIELTNTISIHDGYQDENHENYSIEEDCSVTMLKTQGQCISEIQDGRHSDFGIPY